MHTSCLRMRRGRARRDVSRAESYGSHHDHSPAHCLMAQRSRIGGRHVDVRLSGDQLDTLLDALDCVHVPFNGWDFHESLRRHIKVAYDCSQGVQ